MDNFINNNRLIRGVFHAFQSFLKLHLVLILLFALIRIYEFFYLSTKLSLQKNAIALQFKGLGYDILFLFTIAAYVFLPFWLIHIVFRRIAITLYAILVCVFAISELILIHYLGSTSLILGVDLYGYSLGEIKGIIAASGALSILSVLPFIIGLGCVITLLYFSNRIKIKNWVVAILLPLSFLSLFFQSFCFPDSKNYKAELDYYQVVNKSAYLFHATYTHFIHQPDPNEEQLFSFFYTNIQSDDKGYRYVNSEFPFLHYDDTKDFLGKYFNATSQNPNIVFIIVESLGRAYSGEGAYLTSFTPFIDSLEKKSLYFENIVSSAGRTFEVFPSVLGSLPYGKSGFCEMGADMPNSISIISLLKQRGYTSNFFYGGDANFDNMRLFMNNQGIDRIIDEKSFEKSYSKMPATSGGFTWGYGDYDLFKKALATTPSTSEPRLDIYLTLAMHDPYYVPKQEYYNRKFEEKLDGIHISDRDKDEYRKYKLNYASIMYFDDAIRSFFQDYSKRSDFKNTIFVITGDHRMSTPPIATQIDRFHVPLIIYSPMLNKAEKFSSVSSHLDFTPSIIALLKNKYGMTFPSVIPWLGKGLDSCKTFRNIHSYPFIRTKNQIIDFIDGDYFLADNQLFKVSENLRIEKYNDDKKLGLIQAKFEKFKSTNKYACDNNRIVPDSLVVRTKK